MGALVDKFHSLNDEERDFINKISPSQKHLVFEIHRQFEHMKMSDFYKKCLSYSEGRNVSVEAFRMGLSHERMETNTNNVQFLFDNFTRDGKLMSRSAFLKMVS